ncbi:unnamed protein product [Staurois parvus]|uniref:Uncharacterized protein n=1 Tax=Staurois parvus TaxID=386267 RepID=A0ABN9HIG0_9NEOB|nr:unnamed protein product [Staurois parvus]
MARRLIAQVCAGLFRESRQEVTAWKSGGLHLGEVEAKSSKGLLETSCVLEVSGVQVPYFWEEVCRRQTAS